MILQICTVYDKAAAAYNRPIFVPSLGMAIRSFEDEVSRDSPDNAMHKHPSDFELWHLGSWDDVSGQFENQQPATLLTTGQQVVNSKG